MANVNSSLLSLKEALKQRLLDTCDLQELFKVSRGTISNWCKNRRLKPLKIGGRTYFDAKDIENMLEEYKQNLVPPQQGKRKK